MKIFADYNGVTHQVNAMRLDYPHGDVLKGHDAVLLLQDLNHQGVEWRVPMNDITNLRIVTDNGEMKMQ